VIQAGRTLVSAPLGPRPGPVVRFAIDPAQPAMIRLLRGPPGAQAELAARPVRPGELLHGSVRLESPAHSRVDLWAERERK
jgi:hypothetical protein